MRKWLAVMTCLSLLLVAVLFAASPAQAEKSLTDGTYKLDYTVLKAEDDSVSIANDYWEKPATIIVKDGQILVQMQVNHSKWITEFKTPSQDQFHDVDVIRSDSDADTRVVQFKVDDLSVPLESKIHVTVESLNYDHSYTIRFAFDMDSLQSIQSIQSNQNVQKDQHVQSVQKDQSVQKPVTPVTNPQTGDTRPIALWCTLLAITSLYLVRYFKTKTKGE